MMDSRLGPGPSSLIFILWVAASSGFAAPPQENSAADSALRLRYTFEEVAGASVPDVSGNGHDGTLEGKDGKLPSIRQTLYGPALELLGDLGHGVRIKWADDLACSQGLTLMAWVRPTEVRRHLAIVAAKGDRVKGRVATGYRMSVFWNRILMDIGLGGEAGVRLSSPEWSLAPVVWSHVGVTFDGKVTAVYINATRVAENELSEPGLIAPFGRDMTIGKYFWNDAYPFTGLLGDVRIYDRALTPDEIFSAATVFLHAGDRTGE